MVSTRPRIQDIARVSGLSSATVDRVLNSRPGVSAKAVDLVRDAIQKLAENGPEERSDFGVYDIILPRNAGLSTEYLAAAFRYHADLRKVQHRVTFVERLNPQSLCRALQACAEQGTSGVAFQALEDPTVRDTVSQLANRNIPLVTVVSDLSSMGVSYVGLDNRAAGRTAGYLMGLLTRGAGPIAVLWGGHLYRAHDEREFGFRSALRTDFPNLEILDVTCTQDDTEEAYERLSEVLERDPKLAGVYCVGAGIIGAINALKRHAGGSSSFVIGHNLTANTRDFLLQRRMEVVIHQDMTAIAEKALQFLVSGADKPRSLRGEVSISIVTRENISNHLNLDMLRDYMVKH